MTKRSNVAVRDSALSKAKILSVISVVLLVLAIVFCTTVILQVTIRGYVSILGFSVFRVATPSMEPALPVGTFIVSKKTDINELEKDDIICFVSKEAYMNGSIITHRIVEIKEIDSRICLITRGDANNSVDAAYVTEDNLVGKMVLKTDPNGFFSTTYKFLTQKQVFFLVIILPMLVVAGFLLKNGIKKIHQQINEIKKEIENDSQNAADKSDCGPDTSEADQTKSND